MSNPQAELLTGRTGTGVYGSSANHLLSINSALRIDSLVTRDERFETIGKVDWGPVQVKLQGGVGGIEDSGPRADPGWLPLVKQQKEQYMAWVKGQEPRLTTL